MTIKFKKGLGLMMVIVSVTSSNCVVADTADTTRFVAEEELVSLRTIATESAITVVESAVATTGSTIIVTGPAIATNPSMTMEEKEEKVSAVVVEMETLKSVKKYFSLKEVRKRFNKRMNISKPSGLPKEEFVKLIRNMDYDYTGVFKRNAELIWNLARKYRFNEIFFMGIIAQESLWGSSEQAVATNNYTSQMRSVKKEKEVDGEIIVWYEQVLKSYATEKECFKETAKNLGENYLRKNGKFYHGVTVYAVNKEYCEPGKHEDGTPYPYKWGDGVLGCMEIILKK